MASRMLIAQSMHSSTVAARSVCVRGRPEKRAKPPRAPAPASMIRNTGASPAWRQGAGIRGWARFHHGWNRPQSKRRCSRRGPALGNRPGSSRPSSCHSPCSNEQRDRLMDSRGGLQLSAPPHGNCPPLGLLRRLPLLPLLAPPLPLPPPPPAPAEPTASAAAFAAADSGRKKWRKPARVSTRWPTRHLLLALFHRSMLPCLQDRTGTAQMMQAGRQAQNHRQEWRKGHRITPASRSAGQLAALRLQRAPPPCPPRPSAHAVLTAGFPRCPAARSRSGPPPLAAVPTARPRCSACMEQRGSHSQARTPNSKWQQDASTPGRQLEQQGGAGAEVRGATHGAVLGTSAQPPPALGRPPLHPCTLLAAVCVKASRSESASICNSSSCRSSAGVAAVQ